MTDHPGMRIALQQARQNPNDHWKHGATITKGRRILSQAINRTHNNPKHVDWRHCSEHAEVGALRKASETEGATAFVARVTRGGAVGLSRPCPACMKALRSAGVRKVVYTLDDGSTEELKL